MVAAYVDSCYRMQVDTHTHTHTHTHTEHSSNIRKPEIHNATRRDGRTVTTERPHSPYQKFGGTLSRRDDGVAFRLDIATRTNMCVQQ